MESRHDQPTTDTTSRPADTERQARCLQADASGCKGGKAYASRCKEMQAEKQGGRGKGERGKGQAGANLAKRRKRKKPWRFQRGLMLLRGLMRQGSFAPLARLLPPAPSPCPPPLPGGGKYLRLQLWQAAGASQSSDLRSRSALIRLLMYRPLLGKLDSQNSFSWSSRKDIIF